ncbi:MAG TPA: amidohydrolase family protein [Syntrophorhabdaceae bacterium]|nr:amidohydrolase family protein [Syntrophorhabdaceae bacterium]
MNILIKGVTLADKIKDIFIEDGKITEISANSSKKADKIIDGRYKIALPSLINGHTHAAMTLFRGYADDLPLKVWLEEKIWPLEAKLTEEDVYWGSKLACLEMIKNGITVFNDMYWHWEATAKATYEMGIRGFISGVFIDMFDEKKADAEIEENIRLYEVSKRYEPYVKFSFGPHAIYTVSKKSLEWIRDFSDKHDIIIHMHLLETRDEIRFTKERYGLSTVDFLDSIGVLSERYIGCHGCWVDEHDCFVLRKTKSKIVHMPVSNMKLTVGRVVPHFLFKEYQIPYCFGTDGCASNNHLDIIETIKFASLLAKFFTHDPTVLPAKEAFNLATKTAAEIFFLGDWEIKEGNSPDIILIDTRKPEFTPGFDIYSDIVYASNGYAVDTVICMGKVLMEERHVPGEEEILRQARRIAKKLIER